RTTSSESSDKLKTSNTHLSKKLWQQNNCNSMKQHGMRCSAEWKNLPKQLKPLLDRPDVTLSWTRNSGAQPSPKMVLPSRKRLNSRTHTKTWVLSSYAKLLPRP